MLLKLFENLSKIEQKTTPDRWKCVLGTFSAPNRAQVGSKMKGVSENVDVFAENVVPTVGFGTGEKSKSVKGFV